MVLMRIVRESWRRPEGTHETLRLAEKGRQKKKINASAFPVALFLPACLGSCSRAAGAPSQNTTRWRPRVGELLLEMKSTLQVYVSKRVAIANQNINPSRETKQWLSRFNPRPFLR